MGVLTIILVVLGGLMLIEGLTVLLYPKFTWKIALYFIKGIENHLKVWGIGEIIIAIALIALGLTL